jgi:hypothetical protein
MIVCDLCGQTRKCLQHEIDGKEYDICAECWNPLGEKLKEKGRAKKEKEIVFLPPQRDMPKEDEGPKPGAPPKIWGGFSAPAARKR